jgi:thiosulfate reductase cytochrome b subunit
MKASTERKTMRWIHIILSVPIVDYIYGGLAAERPDVAFATKFVFIPVVILSGLWMWKGHFLRNLSKQSTR